MCITAGLGRVGVIDLSEGSTVQLSVRVASLDTGREYHQLLLFTPFHVVLVSKQIEQHAAHCNGMAA
jgi:hypothetical protein